MNLQTRYERRATRTCTVGTVKMGSRHPVVVQSMITEETRNVDACVEQIMAHTGHKSRAVLSVYHREADLDNSVSGKVGL